MGLPKGLYDDEVNLFQVSGHGNDRRRRRRPSVGHGSNRAAQTVRTTYAAYDAPAKQLLAKMTLDEKVGQMCQPDQNALRDPADIEKFFLGSLLSGGGSGPKNKADYTLQGWTDMVDGYQRHALKTRLGIPLLYGVDAVHGHNNIPGASSFRTTSAWAVPATQSW